MTYYVPGLGEKDPDKTIRSLMQAHENTATNTADIATNAADIAALESSRVTGPASATANGFAVYDGTTGKLIKDHAATIALGSEVTGTLPVARGGTNYTGGAWTTYSPTVTASSGTFTSVSAAGSYLEIGKLVFFIVNVTITTAGTAAGNALVPLPVGTAVRAFSAVGTETVLNGIGLHAFCTAGSSSLVVREYDTTTAIASGAVLTVSGFYEQT